MEVALNRQQEPLDYALYYAKRGWSVIPLTWPSLQSSWCKAPGKQPMLKGWQNQTTVEETKICQWFRRWPQAGIGIKTGVVSGLVILDVDPKNGGDESLQDLIWEYGSLPETPQVLTGGGGRHYYFKYPTGQKVYDKIGFAPGLDIRGDGGQVVAPPSLHVSGRRYEWEQSSCPDDIPLAEIPTWLMYLTNQPKQSDRVTLPDIIPEGRRNDAIFRIACSLRDKGLSQEAILAAIRAENGIRCNPPLPQDEIKIIVSQATKYEPKRPILWGVMSVPISGIQENLDEWLEPLPLKDDRLQPVNPLPSSILPSPLKPWLMDVAFRMQCPLDFVATSMMVVLSSVIGAGCGIRPKKNDDWEVVPNLWGGIVGRPSTMKTPSLAETMKPLSWLEAVAGEQFAEDSKLFMARNEVFKARREAIKADMIAVAKGKKSLDMGHLEMELAALDAAEEPKPRRFKTNDSTVEKLGELLNENLRGILVFRDELTGLLASWEREDRQTDRAFYLEAWNGGQPYITDRIGRGTVGVKSCCLSLLGGIQPAKLMSYLLQADNSLQNDGMLQRFQLLVYPDDPKDWQLIDQSPDISAKNRAYEVIKSLSEMDFFQAGAVQADNRPYFRFDAEGQCVFYQWLIDLETKIREEDNHLVCEHLAKYRSLMPSLALVFHLVDVAAGGNPGPVPRVAAEKAAAWVDYLESHARRIYGMLTVVQDKAAVVLAEKIKAGKVQDGFSVRDIYKNFAWHLLNTKESVEGACRELEELNWLRKSQDDTGGRPKTIYRINPKVFS